jgi:hypothetical protein
VRFYGIVGHEEKDGATARPDRIFSLVTPMARPDDPRLCTASGESADGIAVADLTFAATVPFAATGCWFHAHGLPTRMPAMPRGGAGESLSQPGALPSTERTPSCMS